MPKATASQLRSLNLRSERRIEVEPVWAPLERRLGKARCVGFMFMGRVNGINLTSMGSRTPLNLDDEGKLYLPGGRGTYVPADWRTELGRLEAGLAALGSTLTTSYDKDFIAQKRKVLQRQGISLLTITVDPHETNVH
jgi:hypothetical protein